MTIEDDWDEIAEAFQESDWDNEEHPYDCDCDECEEDRAFEECGRLPPYLGGGCSKAGSEHCDFDCPFREAFESPDEDEEE